MLDVEACFGLVGGVHVLATLPKLKKLNISDTQLDGEGLVVVEGCQVGRYGAEQTPLLVGGRLWAGADRTATAGGDGRSAWRRSRQGDHGSWNHATDPGRLPTVPRGRQSAPAVPCQREPGEVRWSFTPLLFAAQQGSAEVVQLLLEHGAHVNKANKKKDTPLHLAAYNGHIAIVRLLLENRADATSKNQWGRTPLATARMQGHDEVAMLLGQPKMRGAGCCPCQ